MTRIAIRSLLFTLAAGVLLPVAEPQVTAQASGGAPKAIPGSTLTPLPGGAPHPSAPDPAKPAEAKPSSNSTYVIGAEDMLQISVLHEAELTGPRTVQPDGKITLPLVQEVAAAGLTPVQLEAAIVQELSKVMVNPVVSVAVLQVNSKKYFIQGEVQKPGAYPLAVPTTVLEGLVNAGGFRDFADLKHITILRGAQRMNFNFKQVRAGKHLEQNIVLQPGDEIFVK
jgi:polysaccharide biosynthesis/export protein